MSVSEEIPESERQSFSAAIEELGTAHGEFKCVYARDEDGEAFVEITYLPSGETRWYDVKLADWVNQAVNDFRDGKFERGYLGSPQVRRRLASSSGCR